MADLKSSVPAVPLEPAVPINAATVNSILERVARLKPNAIDDRDAARWIMDLNDRLIRELHMPPDTPRPVTWPEDGDMPLAASGPYDELYVFYTVAMIEFYQREYGNYNNSIIQFNDRCADFRRAWRRGHMYRPQREYEGVF